MFAKFHQTSSDSLVVYSVDMEDGEPAIRAFSVDVCTKKLSEISKVDSKGEAPCHLTVGSSGEQEYLFCANYTGGTVSVCPIGADGKLSPACSTVSLQQ